MGIRRATEERRRHFIAVRSSYVSTAEVFRWFARKARSRYPEVQPVENESARRSTANRPATPMVWCFVSAAGSVVSGITELQAEAA